MERVEKVITEEAERHRTFISINIRGVQGGEGEQHAPNDNKKKIIAKCEIVLFLTKNR
jgi:hypothetical protein